MFNNLNKATTTTIIALSVVGFSFLILLLTVIGIVHSPQVMQTQIIQLVSSLLLLVLGYYFGATHQSNQNQSNKTKMSNTKQVFWDIESLDQLVLTVNGVEVNIPAKDLPSYNSDFELGLDTTDIEVLMVTTASPVNLLIQGNGLTYISTSVAADFSGSRPIRPNKPK